jgi:hypothetical protein
MRQLVYALRFTGQAVPSDPGGGVLRVVATAPGSMPGFTVEPGGACGGLGAVLMGETVLETEMTLTGATSFQAIGVIAFGGDTALRVAVLGGGYLGPGATRRHGAVTWRVEEGRGQLAGASGLITSNLLLGTDLTMIDYHLGMLFLP